MNSGLRQWRAPLPAILLTLFVGIHLSYYAATFWTDHLQWFVPQGTIQSIKTLDYTTVVNGARTFLEGGPLDGNVPRPYPYIRNPHHPALTLTLGAFLQRWDIPTGFVIYALLKLAVTAGLFALLLWRFHHHPNFLIAAFIFLVFFDQSIEINCGQYWFVLNTFTFLLVYWLQQGRSWIGAAGWYLGTLITKPVGLLWIPHLIQAGRARVVTVAMTAYVLLGVGAILFLRGGGWFLVYLFGSAGQNPTNLPRFTLNLLLQTFGVDLAVVEALKYASLLGLLIFTFWLRPPLIQGLMTWSSYSLLWYPWTYAYHYSCLIPFLTLGLLTSEEFNNWFVKACAILLALPTPFFLFRLLGLFPITAQQFEQSPWARDFEGPFDPTRNLADTGLILIMCWRVFPLVALLTGMAFSLWRQRRAESMAVAGTD